MVFSQEGGAFTASKSSLFFEREMLPVCRYKERV
jgi:hypothetical protein